jgi:hypothetical protein
MLDVLEEVCDAWCGPWGPEWVDAGCTDVAHDEDVVARAEN